MFKAKLVFFTQFLACNFSMDIIIEDHTILQYFHKGSSLVFGCLYKYAFHHFKIIVHHPGKEIALGPHSQFAWKKRIFDRPVRGGLCYASFWSGGGILSLGQPVYFIIKKKHINIQIPS